MPSIPWDTIGYWTEIKLDIIRKYAVAYATIMAQQRNIRRFGYIDAFCGPGVHVSKQTGEFVHGSPLNALLIQPQFSAYHFIDIDGDKASALRKLAGAHERVQVHEGDCNEILRERIFPLFRYKDYARALCILDPYNLCVDWELLRMAGQMRSIELFYNFMIMDANMNVLWHDPQGVDERQLRRMNRIWGDDSWRDAAYRKEKTLFEEELVKEGNPAFAEAFRRRLNEVAGFQFVPSPLPMRNSKGAVVYYLYFASQNEVGKKIVSEIFSSYAGRSG